MEPALNPDYLEFLEALNRNEVAYIVVGGYSVVFHGYPRTTGDLDVWVERTLKNYRRLALAFSDFQLSLFDMTEENFLNNPSIDVFTFGRSPVAIDILTQVKGLDFAEANQGATTQEIDGVGVRFLAYSDLIAAKKAAGRPRDLNDIENLESGR